MGFPTTGELSRTAEREYKDGATLLEFRLDYLKNPSTGVDLIRRFRQANPDAQILATCRHRRAHGQFGGSIEDQIRLLKASADAGAAFLDCEIETAEKAKTMMRDLREQVPLIVSYHNFESTPALDSVLRRLVSVPADIYKIATTARKPSDNLRLMQLLRNADGHPMIVVAMSEIGAPSRILSPSLGSLFTYAAPNDQEGTAPGQLAARTLRTLYRSDKLSKQSRVYGIIADPVFHSKSPYIHNRAFQSRRLDAVYVPFLVKQNQLADWMKFACDLPVAGFSVTIPHKRRILRHLDQIEPLARRIGAVNTVWRKAGKWRGTNTDADGVLKPLGRHLRLANASVLIAGYGGAARAAAVALHDARATVAITGRNLSSAQSLARVIKGEALTLRQAQQRKFDVLIHATPVGMVPKVDDSLFNDSVPASIVLDMVYNPHETLLLKRARAEGCTIIPGAEMLLEQAVSQFEIWTGESAPREAMRHALEAHL
ncbi:MAG TPA: shikimate dehydrogenase [Bryobacteraceae bacterium]|nr:shikimate dehydrogenase [Bryobacteraceae bacterium]